MNGPIKLHRTTSVCQIMTGVGMLLSYIYAGIDLLGLMFLSSGYRRGSIMNIGQIRILEFLRVDSLSEAIFILIVNLVVAIAAAKVLQLAGYYLEEPDSEKIENGTSFAVSGIEIVKHIF